uniref:PRRT2 n=1 Tax=Ascaris lumbricoides TaxID=6252 RepID=A0A0M3ICD8_ASCLU
MAETCKQVGQIPETVAPPSKPPHSATSASRFQSPGGDGTPNHSLSGTPKIPSLKSEQDAREEKGDDKAIATGDSKRKDHGLSSSVKAIIYASVMFCGISAFVLGILCRDKIL